MPEVKRVQPEDILRPEDGDDKIGAVRLTPLQTVGVRGALIVGALIGAVLMVLLVRWIWVEPAVPNIPPNLDEKQATLILSHYKELQGAVLDGTTKMIDMLVVRILLPIFTTFVGVIFGTQIGSKNA